MNKNDTALFSRWDIPVALVLLTRLPLPKLPEASFARQARAAWAFPLAGLIVGALACGVAWIAIWVQLPTFAAASLLVATLIIVTGAMHEDGLADTVDGLWGGFSAERRLEIMKDSHIGTYGVLALLLSQLLRIAAIATLLGAGMLTGVLAACVFSRALMPALMTLLPNARQTGLSHSVGAPPLPTVLAGLVLAALLSLVLLGSLAFAPMLFAMIAGGIVARIAKAKIGGQTGDILGATQQVGEITFLLALAALI
ncbi:cobalamin biosynthesis protein CobS [Ruegeria sp. ANG-R]|uniref:adenosylcobinamide-GDP ribazoletransferase n=1 Tax=Ruegeria sp. ANG-R TaxID=1577903 RepID=UPI0005802F21|nr:adenosylcobinamide-GDP ribazoletransferase [Ruegeria sp. ANG-R]KIC43426.1 cobalamin biosynthesis protein CobS [Ruegeria sp. ANG-R]